LQNGYKGFYSSNYLPMTPKSVNDIHKRGGTVLGTSRGGHDTKKIVDNIQDRGINQVCACWLVFLCITLILEAAKCSLPHLGVHYRRRWNSEGCIWDLQGNHSHEYVCHTCFITFDTVKPCHLRISVMSVQVNSSSRDFECAQFMYMYS